MGIASFLICVAVLHALLDVSTSVASAKPLLIPLTHTFSASQTTLTTTHLLKTTSDRSKVRHHRHHRHHDRQVSLPLSSGSDYLLSFSVGSSSFPVSLYLDTGSDLVWFPCSPFSCILCEFKPKSPSPPFNISTSSSSTPVSCSSSTCSAAHSSTSSRLCAISRCPIDAIELGECSSFPCPPFYFAYGDGSLVGRLYNDTLSLSDSFTVKNFTFGCSHSTLGEPIGVAGFGPGSLSLPDQLAAFHPQIGNSFSYCLVAHSFNSDQIRRPSPLIIGRFAKEKEEGVGGGGGMEEFVYTQMIHNPKHPYFYTVALSGISVGNRTIQAPVILQKVDESGTGGVVVDSGTTFTMLPVKMYDSVVKEFDRSVGRVNERASRIESETGLRPCYYYGRSVAVPALVLHFAGNKSSVFLPKINYFYEFVDGSERRGKKRNVGCLMLMSGGDEPELQGGPGATLGNYQQQGLEVVYDMEKRRVGFAKRECESLWETYKHG